MENIKYYLCVYLLEHILSENEMEILNDALQCYGRHPEDHAYEGELDLIKSLARAFDGYGHNHTLPEFDILKQSSK